MINRMLVPVDGSEHSRNALEFACDLAKKYKAKMRLLHVVQAPSGSHTLVLGATAISVQTTREQLQEIGHKIIEAARQYAEGLGCHDVDTQIEGGPPAHQILRCARENEVDMIVMGSRGLNSVTGLLIGSVSLKVSHLAECTCITVR